MAANPPSSACFLYLGESSRPTLANPNNFNPLERRPHYHYITRDISDLNDYNRDEIISSLIRIAQNSNMVVEGRDDALIVVETRGDGAAIISVIYFEEVIEQHCLVMLEWIAMIMDSLTNDPDIPKRFIERRCNDAGEVVECINRIEYDQFQNIYEGFLDVNEAEFQEKLMNLETRFYEYKANPND